MRTSTWKLLEHLGWLVLIEVVWIGWRYSDRDEDSISMLLRILIALGFGIAAGLQLIRMIEILIDTDRT